MKTSKKEIFGEINITPLTDIFLVLLIIMMVVAPLINYHGLNVELAAEGSPSVTQEKSKTLHIEIGADGSYKIESRAVSAAELATTILAEAPQNPDGIMISIDPEAQLDFMTLALDAARSAGVEKVVIAGKGNEPAPTTAPAPQPAKPRKAKKT